MMVRPTSFLSGHEHWIESTYSNTSPQCTHSKTTSPSLHMAGNSFHPDFLCLMDRKHTPTYAP
jgi:hypothetical protein